MVPILRAPTGPAGQIGRDTICPAVRDSEVSGELDSSRVDQRGRGADSLSRISLALTIFGSIY